MKYNDQDQLSGLTWDGSCQVGGRRSGSLSLRGVGVVNRQPPAEVDDLHVLEGVVVPGNDLLAVFVDCRVHGDIRYGATDMDVNPDYDDFAVALQNPENIAKIGLGNSKLGGFSSAKERMDFGREGWI